MKVEEGKYSVAEIVDWFNKRDLTVNTEYQRGGGLWPPSAKSYFIDTILKDFPFPKIYFHERLERDTRRPRREIVDGQQRITTIVDYINGRFALGKNAVGHEGKKFSDLSLEEQDSIYTYTISVDVIRNADRSEILQMFRRMNAYTLPLNHAEKRQSDFFGEFKDWVNTFLDRSGSIFVDWGILTSRQIVRLADAELIADLALAIDEGIVSTSPLKLNNIYKRNDTNFPERELMTQQLTEAFDCVIGEFSFLQKTFMTKSHVFHSLICALIHNKFGMKGVSNIIYMEPIGSFYTNREAAMNNLIRLAAAHEEKDSAEFNEYVQAASEGGNRATQRAIRIKWLCSALRAESH